MEGLEGEIVEYEFQQDNATVHTNTSKLMKFFDDLNPIEHLWDELERQIGKRDSPPVSERELAGILQEEWEKISDAVFQKLILSMNSRVKAVQRAEGDVTRY